MLEYTVSLYGHKHTHKGHPFPALTYPSEDGIVDGLTHFLHELDVAILPRNGMLEKQINKY